MQHYADAYVNLFWTGVGIQYCGPNGACVEATKTLGVGFSHFSGSLIYEARRAFANLDNVPTLLSQYETLVAQALANGRAVPTLQKSTDSIYSVRWE